MVWQVHKGYEGYTQGQADHTLFIKHSNDGKIVILIVYVDDIIVIGNQYRWSTKIEGSVGQRVWN